MMKYTNQKPQYLNTKTYSNIQKSIFTDDEKDILQGNAIEQETLRVLRYRPLDYHTAMIDNNQRALIAANLVRTYRHQFYVYSGIMAEAVDEKTPIPRKRQLILQLLHKKRFVKKPLPHSIAIFFYRLHEAHNALKTGFFRRKKPDARKCQDKLHKAVEKLHIILEEEKFLEEILPIVRHRH